MIIVVFSLGQFISSDLNKLKSGFESWFAEQGKGVTGDAVWAWMQPKLPKLRLAEISLEDVCNDFNKDFDVEIVFEKFQEIFNSMSIIDAASLDRIAAFNCYLLSREDMRFVLVSHTNFSHFKCILDQLNVVLPPGVKRVINAGTSEVPKDRILLAPSMYSQCEDHPGTLLYALNRLKIDNGDHVVSFLKTIPSLDDVIKPGSLRPKPDFTAFDAGRSLELADVFEQLRSLDVAAAAGVPMPMR